ncbi:MAG: GGDEF domain-containing protein [Fimbriimonadales bacterium]
MQEAGPEFANPVSLTSHNRAASDTVDTETGLIVMKSVRDLRLWPVWVNPNHSVETATILMKGHGLAGLGVMHGDSFLGILGIEDLVGASPEDRVESLMRRDTPYVTPDMSLRQVAETMARENLPRIAVLAGEKFLGIVNAQDLLRDYGRNFDPLTQLPWSDTLREWGISQLREGHEITIIFFDLDDFGLFNKRFGHIVGDTVLKRVADELKQSVDPDTDHLCRAGGDEFCIGTLRPRDDAELLGQWIQKRIGELTIEGAGMAVTVTVGIHGGRRTKERENVHYASTVDNLVNLASRNCMGEKGKRDPHPFAHLPTTQIHIRPELPTVKALSQIPEDNGAVVVLSLRDHVAAGMKSGCTSTVQATAQATVLAIQKLLDGASQIELVEVTESTNQIRVIGTVEGTAVVGGAMVTGDPHDAAAAAAIQAFQSLFS